VDVYRGNAPFEADELGIGGAVWFEPRKARKTEAAAGTTFGSFGTRSGFGYVALSGDKAGIIAGLSAERADNDYEFNDNRGTLFQSSDDRRRARSNADASLRDFWLVARARPTSRGSVELVLNDIEREQGVPKLALVPSLRARSELSRTLSALTARLALDAEGRKVLTLRTSFVGGAAQIHDPTRELGTLAEETEVRGRLLEQRASLELPLARNVAWAVAGIGGAETLDRRDGAAELSAKASTLRGMTRISWRFWRQASVFALLGAQCRHTEPGDRGCQSFQPTGRVGAGLNGQGYALFFNLSRYQREPALGELYGAGVLVRGNAGLRPELGHAADVGARGIWKAGAFSVQGESSVFVRSASDLVSYARAAQGYVVPVNVGQARVVGAELGGSARAFEHVEVGCNLSLLEPRDTTPGRRLQNDILPFMSRLVLAPRLLVTSGDLEGQVLKRAEASVDLTYLSNRFADAAGLIVIPEQATLGATAALSWLSGVVVTRLRLANLTDAQRFDIVGYPLPGRSVYGSLEVRTP
jgi:vitamin B12 transporter